MTRLPWQVVQASREDLIQNLQTSSGFDFMVFDVNTCDGEAQITVKKWVSLLMIGSVHILGNSFPRQKTVK